ncbi:MAG: hypothetical protein AAF629_11875 [Chloroflexota bacterium]
MTKPPALPLLIVGVVFLTFGGAVAFFFPYEAEKRAERVAAMQPKSVTQLGDTLAGTPVMVEGVVSIENPILVRSFVAYKVKECTTDTDGDEDCDLKATVTPPLIIELPDGAVHISNDAYALNGRFSVYTEGNLDYVGLEVGDIIVTEGTLATQDGSPRITVDYVYLGNRADYIASLQSEGRFVWYLGIFFAFLGGVFLLIVGAILAPKFN